MALDETTNGEFPCSLKVVMPITDFFLNVISSNQVFSLILLWKYFNFIFICIEIIRRSNDILRIYPI